MKRQSCERRGLNITQQKTSEAPLPRTPTSLEHLPAYSWYVFGGKCLSKTCFNSLRRHRSQTREIAPQPAQSPNRTRRGKQIQLLSHSAPLAQRLCHGTKSLGLVSLSGMDLLSLTHLAGSGQKEHSQPSRWVEEADASKHHRIFSPFRWGWVTVCGGGGGGGDGGGVIYFPAQTPVSSPNPPGSEHTNSLLHPLVRYYRNRPVPKCNCWLL